MCYMETALLCESALRLGQLGVHRPYAVAPAATIITIAIIIMTIAAVVRLVVACRVISGRE